MIANADDFDAHYKELEVLDKVRIFPIKDILNIF
jgi:hypothetical protein